MKHGGTAVLAETPEIYGAEHLLTRRAVNRAVGEKLVIVVGLLLHGEALAGVGPTGCRDGVWGKWQATWWPAANDSSGGDNSAHFGWAVGQRVRKPQPEGGLIGLGSSPRMAGCERRRPGIGCGMAEASPRV